MSEHCEIVESVALATETTVTDLIAVLPTSATATSSMVAAYEALCAESATATDWAEPSSYLLLTSSGIASSTAGTTILVHTLLVDTALARDRTVLGFHQTCLAAATATSTVQHALPDVLLASTAVAASAVLGASVEAFYLSEKNGAVATSRVWLGSSESCLAAATATSTVPSAIRSLSEQINEVATATSTSFPSNFPGATLLISEAVATGAVFVDTIHNPLLASEATAESSVWFRDPNTVAWVLNTESTAVSHYKNFGFESIATVGNRTIAASSDGLYVLEGTTDEGAQIPASVAYGFTDFGTQYIKGLDTLMFGYTSTGQVAVRAETYGAGHSPVTRLMDQRNAGAPRNNRISFPLGLRSQYWRFTISNVNGADFEILDISADIAVSARRLV